MRMKTLPGAALLLLITVPCACAMMTGVGDYVPVDDPADGAANDAKMSKDSRFGNDSPFMNDSGCSSQSCTSTAKGCGNMCDNQYQMCKNQFCDGGQCQMCSSSRDSCNNGCISTCKTCQTNASCTDTGQCAQAIN